LPIISFGGHDSTPAPSRFMLRIHFSGIGMTKTEKLLSELIALPSVNPAFLPADDSRAGEQRVADFLAATVARAGLDVEFQKVLPGRSNLLARLSPSGKIRQRILLAPHLDTVPAADASQFIPRKIRGRLFGRGACDTKGSIAALLTALCELARSKQRPREVEIIFAGLVDEENAQAGSRKFAASGLKADLAIVGEPTRLQVVTAHKGSLWLQLEARGKSAHGSRPELGRNAVHTMSRIVDTLETDYAAQLRKRRHGLLGHATVNVGTICGGLQPNTVPDSCSIKIDRRTLPGETETGVRREITALLAGKKLQAKFSSAKPVPSSPLETKTSLPLVRKFMEIAGQNKAAGVDFFCDAAVLAKAGIPSVVFGPGDIAQAHTADEWISLASLERAKEMLLRFLRSLP
jgi:acetylornithine deacetylase/succinyl-diaminopimelate desuccinylase family protein